MGTSITPMQSYAVGSSDLQHKNVTDTKNSVKKDAQSKKKANQHQSKDNASYGGDSQANQ